MEVERQQLFSANVYTTFINSIGDSQNINRVLFNQFLESKRFHTFSHPENNRYENTYVPLQHVPAVSKIFTTAKQIAREITNQQLEIEKNNWWFNYMTWGNVTNIHNHSPGPVMSGVYYIKAPENSGRISFTYKRMHIRESSYFQFIGDYFNDVSFEPMEGMMLLFPSWLDHKVDGQYANGSRLSLAFNLRLPN